MSATLSVAEWDVVTTDLRAAQVRRDETSADVERLRAREIQVAAELETAAGQNATGKIRTLSTELESLPSRIRIAEIVSAGAKRASDEMEEKVSKLGREREVSRLYAERDAAEKALGVDGEALSRVIVGLSGLVAKREATAWTLIQIGESLKAYGQHAQPPATLAEFLAKLATNLRNERGPANVVVVEIPIARAQK